MKKIIITLIAAVIYKNVIGQDTLFIQKYIGRLPHYTYEILGNALIKIEAAFRNNKLVLYRDSSLKFKIISIDRLYEHDNIVSIKNGIKSIDSVNYNYITRIDLYPNDVLGFSQIANGRGEKIINVFYVRLKDISNLKDKLLDIVILEFFYKLCCKRYNMCSIDFGQDIENSHCSITKVFMKIAEDYRDFYLKKINISSGKDSLEYPLGLFITEEVRIRYNVKIADPLTSKKPVLGLIDLGFSYPRYYMTDYPLYLKTNKRELQQITGIRLYDFLNLLLYSIINNNLMEDFN